MTVHLVGVGPGDAELMTIKAARLLATADAVVYDRLIGADVLDYVPPSAERHPVGKTPGQPGPTQTGINQLLVELGRRLETVVRVKGGDPFVFGRGVEELDHLVAAGVPAAVVPGITSAIAGPAAADISVTERGVASGVCIVTATQDRESTPVNWAALARSGLTIVVLMGAKRATEIRDQLVDGGMDPTTPAAVVTNATRLDQTRWQGPLVDLGLAPVQPPSVLVVGPVAARANQPATAANTVAAAAVKAETRLDRGPAPVGHVDSSGAWVTRPRP